jgi:hypothetical protein
MTCRTCRAAAKYAAIVLACLLGAAAYTTGQQTESPLPPPPTFTAEQEQARRAVLEGPAWQDAKKRFDQWLTVQTMYSPQEVAAMRKGFAARIARMTAEELQQFQKEMIERLDVLMSPETAAARDWLDQFYTAQGKREMLEKYGVSNPLKMTPYELQRALATFVQDRQTPSPTQATRAAQDAVREAQLRGAQAIRQQQEAAVQQAASTPAATFGTPYSPARTTSRVQRYTSPYGGHRYTIGPWGGVWWGW